MGYCTSSPGHADFPYSAWPGDEVRAAVTLQSHAHNSGSDSPVAINLIVQHIKDILAGNVSSRPERKQRTRRQSDSLLARPH